MDSDRPRGAKAKIFVIDDSPTGLAFVQSHLEDAGHVVFTFDSPLGISRELMRLKPDLVLVDINMPSITGDKICKLIRTVTGGRNIPILLHSSKSADELRELAKECGADGFVPKSGDPNLLIAAIREYLPGVRGGSSGNYRPV